MKRQPETGRNSLTARGLKCSKHKVQPKQNKTHQAKERDTQLQNGFWNYTEFSNDEIQMTKKYFFKYSTI